MLFLSPTAQAQEFEPGDSCASFPAGSFATSGGPELGGTVHHLICVGSIWTAFDVGDHSCPTNGLVAWYPFEEGSGTTTADLSGNALNGTLTNMEGDEWTTGFKGNALNFNNADDRVVVANNALLEGLTAVTLTAWVYPTADAPTGRGRIISKPGPVVDDDYMIAYDDNTSGSSFQDKPMMRIVNDRGLRKEADEGALKIPQNTWSLVTGVWDGSVMRLYLNTSVTSTATQTGSTKMTGDPLTIGAHYNSLTDRNFPGRIDEVKIFNRALSTNEVYQLYNEGKGCI